jgi:hypothetical protein
VIRYRSTARAILVAVVAAMAMSMSAAAPPTAVPAVEQRQSTAIESALLTAADIPVPGFGPQPASFVAGDYASGCLLLAQVLQPSTRRWHAFAEANLGFDHSVYIDELLFQEPPAESTADMARYSTELLDCRSVSAGVGERMAALTATPIDFGAGTTAIRLDGTYNDTDRLDGYLVLGRVNATTLIGYFFLQVENASDEQAYARYVDATAKAERILGS